MSNNTMVREINKSVDAVLDVQCSECRRVNKHRVLASVDINEENWFGENSVRFWAEYQVILCQGCETTTFRSCSTNSEDWDFVNIEDVEYNETINLYPSRSEGRNLLKDAYLLPSTVQRIYEESIKAMNNAQPVLAGIGIRAIVETICKDKQAPGSNLVQRIDGLVTQGLLTQDGAIILHKIRTLGNDAAHEVKPHTSEQLGLALDVCEHLLQGVYLLPHFAAKTFK